MNITAMAQNRKRCRNLHDDDTSDFMPLSKRINNLHINNVLQVIPNSCPASSNLLLKPTEWGPGPPQQFSEPQDSFHSPQTPESPQYSPELDESQNPYYYNNNKLLFDLFVERMQRNGHSFQ